MFRKPVPEKQHGETTQGEDEMRAFAVGTRSCPITKPKLSVFFCSMLVCFAPPPVLAQFIKQIDEHGNVTYSDDPSYDYAADEPSLENQKINTEQIKRLREILEYRDNLPAPEPQAPKVTVRTGRSVCLRRPSATNPRISCP